VAIVAQAFHCAARCKRERPWRFRASVNIFNPEYSSSSHYVNHTTSFPPSQPLNTCTQDTHNISTREAKPSAFLAPKQATTRKRMHDTCRYTLHSQSPRLGFIHQAWHRPKFGLREACQTDIRKRLNFPSE